jgi:NAD(P)-dependent dehydrogenase (short-subunit alcohol dehydrogenase family)
VRDERAVRALIDDLPRLDVLVNCAGVIRRDAEHGLATFEEVLAVNLTGTMRCCSLARGKLAATPAATAARSSIRRRCCRITAVRVCLRTARARAAWRSSRSRSRSRTPPTAFASMQ